MTRPLVAAPRRPGKPPRHLADLDPGQRRAAVTDLGLPGYRADQLSRHYFARLLDDPAAMTDLPADARDRLGRLLPTLLTEVGAATCDGGATRKSLWRLHDGALVESVTMRYPHRVTICVSSQAGCGMGCPFCATGQQGLVRNLSAAEIVDQVVRAARALRPEGLRVANVVFMGMGEPLANLPAVLPALHRLTDPPPAGLGISTRSVTVSTVGVVPAIERLAGYRVPVRLAVSLHAPGDELRNRLVPLNRRWPIKEVLDAAWSYARRTRRRVSVEYALIRGINDAADQAQALARLLRGRPVHVNLIPLNPTPGSGWTAATAEDQARFVSVLRAAGIPTTVRDTRGREIAGACGQLAAPTGHRLSGR